MTPDDRKFLESLRDIAKEIKRQNDILTKLLEREDWKGEKNDDSTERDKRMLR